MAIKRGDVIKVQVEKLTYGAGGLARHDGQVVFIEHTAPGDLVEAEIVEAKKNFARGQMVRLLQAGSDRIEPTCPVFGRCGGCQWQHLNYSAQLEAKQEILKDVLRKFLPKEQVFLGEITPSPKQFHYRNRIEVKVKDGRVGFYAKGSHDVVAINECLIADSAINKALEELIDSKPEPGGFRIQMDLNGNVTCFNLNRQEDVLGFAQINNGQNGQMQKEVLEIYERYKNQVVVDLYGGYGNLVFPIAMAHQAIAIESVEWNRLATEEGFRRAQQLACENIQFINGDVAAYLRRVKLPEDAMVILDPPREGCDSSVISELVVQAPKVLIYISCDPMTWGRDVQKFLQESRVRQNNYRIATMHGLDMFPQTDHIELLSVFERGS